MGLTSMLGGRPFATKHVDTVNHGLKVGWIDTMANAAEVIEFQPLGDQSHQLHVSPAMSERGQSEMGVDSEMPVSVGIESPCPQPARFGFVHLCPEAFRRGGAFESDVGGGGVPPLVMHIAPAALPRLLGAAIDRTCRMSRHRVTSGDVPRPFKRCGAFSIVPSHKPGCRARPRTFR